MRTRMTSAALGLTLALTACGSSGGGAGSSRDTQRQADMFSIDQIEKTWHKAASTHDVDLMMTLWASDATFNIGTETLTGMAQIRNFFATKAAPFQPGNDWVSDTPAYKIRTTVNGDRGTLYFECDYIDIATKQVVSVVAADQQVRKIGGHWLITSAAAATPTLGA